MLREWFQKGVSRRVANTVGGLLVLTAAITWWTCRNAGSASKQSSSNDIGQSLQKKLTSKDPLLLDALETGQVKEMLGRVEKYSPLHARFAAASLYIAQHEMQNALDEMLSLEEELLKCDDAKGTSLLHAFTLVRIAFLYQALGRQENEKKAWLAVQEKAGWGDQKEEKRKKGLLSESLALLEENFHCEGSGLRDYIRYRLARF